MKNEMVITKTQLNGWKETTLGEVAKIITGKTPPTSRQELFGGNYPFITPTDISDGDRCCGAERNLSGEGVKYQKNLLLPSNTICYTCIASIGKICITGEESFTNQQINSLIVNDQNDWRFVYYLLKYNTPKILRIAGGTITGIINKTQFSNFLVLAPELPEQHSIAGVLSSLDDKIELLRKQNETLEAIARTIFHEWFVEFNFPNENGKPYKASGGKMVESELGEIPEGWRVAVASDIADVSIGRTPPRKESEWFSLNPKDNKWMSIRDLGEVGVFIDKTAEYLTNEAIQRFRVPLIPKNTVVVSFKLTVGRVAITTEVMFSNEAIAQFKQKDSKITPTEYIYLWLKNFDFDSLGSTSSIATATNSEAMRRIPFLIADTKTTEYFVQIVSPLFKKIKGNTENIKSFSCVRDTLLPKLMSGEVEVKSLVYQK